MVRQGFMLQLGIPPWFSVEITCYLLRCQTSGERTKKEWQYPGFAIAYSSAAELAERVHWSADVQAGHVNRHLLSKNYLTAYSAK